MSRVELLEPLFDGGVRNTNFFNGRLLAAEDLRTEQESVRERLAHVGRAAGAGVVAGLWVEKVPSGSPPGDASHAVVSVTAGLAVSRSGQALSLPADTEVALVSELDPTQAEDAGLFKVCLPPTTSTVLTGAGVYVLAVTSASGYEGKAQASGLRDVSAGRCCGARYAVEGVRFKLVSLQIDKNPSIDAVTRARLVALTKKTDAASLSLLRNELAHACFGGADYQDFVRDPFEVADSPAGGAGDYGALAALRQSGALTSCDVPLALVYWSKNGIEFVDPWAVRRRVTRAARADRWSQVVDERRASEGEARFRQFQDQLEALRDAGVSVAGVRARDNFRYLPPVGFVPLGVKGEAARFAYPNFFEGLTCHRPIFIEGARVGALVRLACTFAAHDLNPDPFDVNRPQMLWLYRVRQNRKAFDEGSAAARDYLIFTSGHVPFAGEARYDVSLWDYSNYV
ncbi:MAG: hypothetical protein ACJ741_03045 [Pyrinomonadaceae bacterium]